ncbi:MAG: hypothetical protein J6X44_10710 [Thermoguttaceae bacterium]|nr:hypothetical protein [Thermoguttaceae bacterium]
MKNIAVLFAASLALATLIGCGSQRGTNGSASPESASSDVDAQANGSGAPESGGTIGAALVVYFSRTGEQYSVGKIDKGNTAIVAEIIAEKTGAALWEVVPENDVYPKDDYDKLTDIAKQELNKNVRPAYVGDPPDLSQYDVIFFGAPVWWGDWPTIMYTFFENNVDALAGKTLVPFATHEGSGLSGFDKKLAAAQPDANVAEGLAIKGTDAQKNQDKVAKSVADWLTKLGY